MKIGTLTGAATYSQRFETPCQKIVIAAEATQEAHITESNITITMMDRDGNLKTITPKTKIGDLMEIAASNEGFVRWEKTATPTYKVLGTVELSNYGAIDIQGGYFQLQIDGAVTTTVWNLYALEVEDLTNSIIRYSPVWCAANQYKDVQVLDSYAIAVPVANIDELHVTHSNGRTNIYTLEELKAIANEVNELAIMKYNYTAGVNEAVPGYNNFLVIGIAGAISVRVRCTAESTIYVIDDEIL